MTYRPFLLTTALAMASYAYAAEHSVPCNTLPDAVQQRSKSLLENGTTVHGCVKDVSAGKTTYEMELITPKGSKDVTFSPLGDILEIEEQVDPAALPPPSPQHSPKLPPAASSERSSRSLVRAS